MVVEIPQDAVKTLSAQAREAGFDSVESYAAAWLVEISSRSDQDELGIEKLSELELQASLAMLDQSMAELAAGEGEDFEQFIDELADELGLKLE
jgi:ribonuclease HII